MATITAPVTGKRKRQNVPGKASISKKPATEPAVNGKKKSAAARVDAKVAQVGPDGAGVPSKPIAVAVSAPQDDGPLFLQIVTGSYERTLHGISASVPRHLLQTAPDVEDPAAAPDVTFSDTFLFAAHSSSIRCLAVSPPTEADKRFLATGGSDERINVYSVSTAPPKADGKAALPSLTANAVTENPRNRSLGSLIHHDRAITRLDFPAKGKLFSAAEDNTIAISRTRDWTVLSSIKAPIPKAQGRPSGDTAAPGETPAGVNDFAIHPSQKLMLSVGRGERSLRLWNLMTGKKAGVLNFDRNLLVQVGESKYSSGEGRRVLWTTDGEAYIVGFERGAAVFGIDSKPKAIIRPSPSTKLHQSRVLRMGGEDGSEVFAASTEDGRVLFFGLDVSQQSEETNKLPLCACLAQLGGQAAGISGRIKDFEILRLKTAGAKPGFVLLIITASSDGAVRLWSMPDAFDAVDSVTADEKVNVAEGAPKQVGSLIATLETGSRITCLGAFVLDGKASEDAANGQDDAATGADEGDERLSSEED
ncbi:hypothetical protein LTR36_002244 [Oleoguttula mirabilis]|uniref:Uncharacterized protein n=1 Tax=Oleoguttula mirabilis TaxID=1507867 RepID=A0AAV9JLA5_9PEZI|nr:hypothetical protein LTR36_002244 [Oleoguttula mirabilis]